MLRDKNLPIAATLEEASQESEAVVWAESLSQALDFDRFVLRTEYQTVRDFFGEGIGRLLALAAEGTTLTRSGRTGSCQTAESWLPGVMSDVCSRLTIEFSRSDNVPEYDVLTSRRYRAPKAWPKRWGESDDLIVTGITSTTYRMEPTPSGLDISTMDVPILTYQVDKHGQEQSFYVDTAQPLVTQTIERFVPRSFDTVDERICRQLKHQTVLATLGSQAVAQGIAEAQKRDKAGDVPDALRPQSPRYRPELQSESFWSPGYGFIKPYELAEYMIRHAANIGCDDLDYNSALTQDLMLPHVARLARLALQLPGNDDAVKRIRPRVPNRLEWIRQNGLTIQKMVYDRLMENPSEYRDLGEAEIGRLSEIAVSTHLLADQLSKDTEPLSSGWQLRARPAGGVLTGRRA